MGLIISKQMASSFNTSDLFFIFSSFFSNVFQMGVSTSTWLLAKKKVRTIIYKGIPKWSNFAKDSEKTSMLDWRFEFQCHRKHHFQVKLRSRHMSQWNVLSLSCQWSMFLVWTSVFYVQFVFCEVIILVILFPTKTKKKKTIVDPRKKVHYYFTERFLQGG